MALIFATFMGIMGVILALFLAYHLGMALARGLGVGLYHLICAVRGKTPQP